MTKYAVFDGHNDLAWASRRASGYSIRGLDTGVPALCTDLPRMAEGGLAAQFWSVWVDPVLEGAEQVVGTLEQIDFVHRFITAYPEKLLTGERPEPTFLVTKPFNPEMVKALISQALFFDEGSRAAA